MEIIDELKKKYPEIYKELTLKYQGFKDGLYTWITFQDDGQKKAISIDPNDIETLEYCISETKKMMDKPQPQSEFKPIDTLLNELSIN